MSKNPTARQDLKNLNLPEELQFPGVGPNVRSIDTADHEDYQLYPHEIDMNYTTLRCSREKYGELPEAQAFFNKLRETGNWRGESAIFRTARFWVKRVVL